MAERPNADPVLFERVAIIGLGLIGGSIGKAIKANGVANRVVGFAAGNHPEQALTLGLVDEIADSAAAAAKEADLIIVATPVTTVPSVFAQIASTVSDQALITDCASTKGTVVDAAPESLGSAFDQYVPGHPIAGSELSGPSAAKANLFVGKRWLFSPLNEAQTQHVGRLMSFANRLGARSATLNAAEHDALFAEYSHAPHALVYALCLAVANGPHASQLADLAGAGFRDTTRIGASSPTLWADILFDNAKPTLDSLERVSDAIKRFADVLASGDKQALEDLIGRAAAWRAQLESKD